MQATSTESTRRVDGNSAALFSILLLVDSLHFIFARALLPHMPPTASAMYVLLIASVQVGIYGLATRRLLWPVALRHWRFFGLVGLLVAVSTALNYGAVARIDAGTASMLGKMTTLYSLLFGVFWLRERLSRRQIWGALLAVVGVFVITFQPLDSVRIGSVMILISTLLYAIHAAAVKRYGGEIDFLSFFFFRLLFTAGILLLIASVQRVLVWPTPIAWLLLLATATVDVTISRSLYYIGLRRLPISLFSIILTVSPVISILWSVLLFDGFPAQQQLLGGGLVLAGVLLATWRTAR